jgi:hypothetical protein
LRAWGRLGPCTGGSAQVLAKLGRLDGMVGSQWNDAQPGLIRGARIQVVYSQQLYRSEPYKM